MSDELPLVSIVIPAYNHADYLTEAIESILAQDYPNIELLVLDDGSTDNTREVLEGYAGRFYWETHKDNMGQAATLNKGWRMSKGEILGRLSADDLLYPEAVSASVKCLRKNLEAVLVYCDFELIDEHSRVIRRIQAPEFSYRDMVAKLITAFGPGTFFPRSALEKAGPWDESLTRMPDYEYWLRLGLYGRFVRIPRVLTAFRMHENSISFREGDESGSQEYIRILTDYFDSHVLPPEVVAAKDEAFSNAYIFAASHHLTSKRYVKAAVNVWKGLRMYPRNLSVRMLRILAYGLLNRTRYRLKQLAKNLREKRPM
ncbi:MAG: glycosyltransferase [Rubrobacter sp.]|nr:glycosyltransferase [Rubrobacter sp.]